MHRKGRWFAASQSESGARKLRAVLVESLVSDEQIEPTKEPITEAERQRRKIQVIRTRLTQVIEELRGRI